MSDGKRRLPLYTEPSDFNDVLDLPFSEERALALNFNPPVYFPFDCFKSHSENETSIQHHLRGLQALNQGYWSLDAKEREGHFQTAFGHLHLAHLFDKEYFCNREALSHVAELLSLPLVEGGEKYANSLKPTPTIDGLASKSGTVPNPGYVCHLLHPGFYSAADLSRLEASLKGE